MPGLIDWDAEQGLLILELVRNGEDIEELTRRTGRFRARTPRCWRWRSQTCMDTS